ncbi:MAG: tetratricopeptide repeat protein, partial [Acidobacteria bacterium]|nr:tetratricopeptide repeat protein [Acidobacteriota bacterium]
LWAKSFDGELADVIALEGSFAQAIAEEIQVAVTPQEKQRLHSAHRINPAARDEYLLGSIIYRRDNPSDAQRAAEHFEKAIRLQPDYAEAYASLSLTKTLEGGHLLEGKAAATRALELDPNLSEAHAAMAEVKEILEWDWAGADREFRRAMELNPASLDACGCYAAFLAGQGRLPEAFAIIEHAEAVTPQSSLIELIHGIVLYFAHRFSEAVPYLQRAIELEPHDELAYIFLGIVYEQLGKSRDALALLDRPEFRPSGALALAYVKAGHRAEALNMLRTLTRLHPNPDMYGTAVAYFALGDIDRGAEWLGKSLDAKEEFADSAKLDPAFDSVRSDPRYQRVAARLKILD